MDRSVFSSVAIGISIASSIVWLVFLIRLKIGISIECLFWEYGLIFIFMGIAMIGALKKYSNDVISSIQSSIRDDILRPFLLLPDDVDVAVDKGTPIYVEGPSRDIFYIIRDITGNGSTVESVVTGDKVSYKGDVKKDLKNLITDGFHVYLKQAYDEMISCGFEIYKY